MRARAESTVLYKSRMSICSSGWDAAVPQTSSLGSVIGANLRPGNVYLVEERRPSNTFALYDQTIASGYAGMIITRDFPMRLAEEQDVRGSKVVWLTNLVGEGRMNPTAIGLLMGQIRNFIEANPRTVVLIDGLEYLVSLNTYDRMLQFMHQLRDIVVTHESILLVPLDTRTLGQREVAMLERSMEPIVPRSEAEGADESMIHHGEEGVLRLLDVGSR